MKINIEIELPDDFEPCTYGCDLYCPFGHIDEESCYHMYQNEWSCPVKDAIKKGD